MDAVRDLGCDDPWQESLERSRARRQQQSKRSTKRRRRHGRRYARALACGAAGLGVLAPVALALPSVLTPASRGTTRATQAAAIGQRRVGGPLHSLLAAPQAPRAPRPRQAPLCRSGSASDGYVDPLAGAHVTGERVDQGVDYAGTGTLAALGAGRITYVGTSATGWPGAFIEFQLAGGSDAGCFVYYAEGVRPAPGLHVGQAVAAGQAVAKIIPGWATGIELGWGSGNSTGTYAAQKRQWSAHSDANSVASAAGKDFSAMIAALGGPGGRVEG